MNILLIVYFVISAWVFLRLIKGAFFGGTAEVLFGLFMFLVLSVLWPILGLYLIDRDTER